MGKVARNSLKGYTYQQYIFTLFLSIMDTERNISKIESESICPSKFDDIYFEYTNKETQEILSYRMQIKNYPNTCEKDISIKDNSVSIKGNVNELNPNDNNILIVNTKCIKTTDIFMGLPCLEINKIIIIPITPEQIEEKIDSMFSTESRELQIINKAYDITINSKFIITIKELPELIQLSTNLENETIILRKVPDNFPNNITFFEGKPGVGKSHFVNEIINKFPDAIVYRFWINFHDQFTTKRLQFDTFFSDLCLKVFNSPKRVSIDELIWTIEKENKLIIIDGLDHVENYNPHDLKYFINFINKLSNTRTVVLSRPLQTKVSWKKEVLLDWTFDEIRLYLDSAYSIKEYKIVQQIYNISKGYPLITYYLAEEYKQTNKIGITSHIDDINIYYDSLFINPQNSYSPMCTFAVGNIFFTNNELKILLENEEFYNTVYEFIKTHPYLFKIEMNRISLFHDSFNTYLREKITTFSKRKKQVIDVISKSLLNGSIEYAARMNSFNFNDDFYSDMLKKYSNFDNFKELLLSTRDYDSIRNLYNELQKELEERKNVLDIYEYYSFALIFQIVNRNDLIGYDSLVYQMLKYMKLHDDNIENQIFSSGYIWQVYLILNDEENTTLHYLANMNIGEYALDDLKKHISEDINFYNKKEIKINYCDLIEILKNKSISIFDKEHAVTNYLISIYVHENTNEIFYKCFNEYILNDNYNCIEIKNELCKYGMKERDVNTCIKKAVYQLHELGYFEDKNKFRNINLYNLIAQNAYKGSENVSNLVESYLKLANYEKREVDISSLGYIWAMYFTHKDFSVLTIDDALISFEEKNLIDWKQSFKIISKLMDQSDDGISRLLTNYINKKGPHYISQLHNDKYFKNDNIKISFYYLNSENYNSLDQDEITLHIKKLIKHNYLFKEIDGKDIRNIMHSKYKNFVLGLIKQYNYSIVDLDIDLIPDIDLFKIKYTVKELDSETKVDYIPLKSGYIDEKDFEYISKNKIDYLEVAKYTDGWYNCLPFVEVFSLYPEKDIQENCNAIIHNSMFARVSEDIYIGEWRNLIGNIPKFLLKYNINIDWDKLYGIFKDFLDLSSIYYEGN